MAAQGQAGRRTFRTRVHGLRRDLRQARTVQPQDLGAPRRQRSSGNRPAITRVRSSTRRPPAPLPGRVAPAGSRPRDSFEQRQPGGRQTVRVSPPLLQAAHDAPDPALVRQSALELLPAPSQHRPLDRLRGIRPAENPQRTLPMPGVLRRVASSADAASVDAATAATVAGSAASLDGNSPGSCPVTSTSSSSYGSPPSAAHA